LHFGYHDNGSHFEFLQGGWCNNNNNNNNNKKKKRSKHNMSPKLCLGDIITIFQSKYTTVFVRLDRIEIIHGSQNVFWVLTWVGRY
jgi:hypothetical protein